MRAFATQRTRRRIAHRSAAMAVVPFVAVVLMVASCGGKDGASTNDPPGSIHRPLTFPSSRSARPVSIASRRVLRRVSWASTGSAALPVDPAAHRCGCGTSGADRSGLHRAHGGSHPDRARRRGYPPGLPQLLPSGPRALPHAGRPRRDRAPIGGDGRVAKVESYGACELAPESIACMYAVAQRLRFPPPTSGSDTVTIPATFTSRDGVRRTVATSNDAYTAAAYVALEAARPPLHVCEETARREQRPVQATGTFTMDIASDGRVTKAHVDPWTGRAVASPVRRACPRRSPLRCSLRWKGNRHRETQFQSASRNTLNNRGRRSIALNMIRE